MSDNDDFMLEDDEDYGFDYEDDDEEEGEGEDGGTESLHLALENKYYSAKAVKEESPKEALQLFRQVMELDRNNPNTKSDWAFKALKQMTKLSFATHEYSTSLEQYQNLLKLAESNSLTKNYIEKSITNLLDLISAPSVSNTGAQGYNQFLQRFFQETLAYLEKCQNERLWFKTNVKLAKLFLDSKDYGSFPKTIRSLRSSCLDESGSDDPKKGTQLLEIYALEIVYYTETQNNKKLKQLYEQSLHVKSAIPHPKIMAVIRECGGKMHMREGDYDKAQTDFFEAFKSYDEAGMSNRAQSLKYLVLANMLAGSSINPFDSQETKPYKNDKNVMAMTDLLNAYQRNEINEFEGILKRNRTSIMEDSFIRNYIEELLVKIRTQVLLKVIKPYRRVDISFISKKLNISDSEVEELLLTLITDNLVKGRIDQISQVLVLGTGRSADLNGGQKGEALLALARALDQDLSRMLK